MHIILIVVFLLAVVALAPAKVAVTFVALMILIPAIAKYSAQSLAHVEVSFTDAAKAVALALFILFLAVLALLSAGKGTVNIGAVMAILLLGAYALGFKLALGIGFRASAVVALATTVVSGILIWIISAAT